MDGLAEAANRLAQYYGVEPDQIWDVLDGSLKWEPKIEPNALAGVSLDVDGCSAVIHMRVTHGGVRVELEDRDMVRTNEEIQKTLDDGSVNPEYRREVYGATLTKRQLIALWAMAGSMIETSWVETE